MASPCPRSSASLPGYAPGHTEVAAQVFFQRAALAVADDRDRLAVEQRHTAQNGGIFLALTVAALLKEVGEQCIHDLIDVGALRVACQKDPVLCGQRSAAGQQSVLLRGKLCQFGSVVGDIGHVLVRRVTAQSSDLFIQRCELL